LKRTLYRLNFKLDFAFRTSYLIVDSTIMPREWNSNEWSCFNDGWKLFLNYIFVSITMWKSIFDSKKTIKIAQVFELISTLFYFVTIQLKTISVKSMNNMFYFQLHLFHCWKQDFEFGHPSSLWKFSDIFDSLFQRCSTNNNCMIRRTIVDSSKMKMNTYLWETFLKVFVSFIVYKLNKSFVKEKRLNSISNRLNCELFLINWYE
jgi:hypothetical protein